MSAHDLTLKHYAREASFKFDPAHVYAPRKHRPDKPAGLWVSVQGPDDWREWCESEGFAVDTLANEHDVTLTLDTHILHIDNLADLHSLTQRWPGPTRWDEAHPDWDAIARDYDGIIIAPYQGRARMDLFWYSGWDCASGCIWNLAAIQSVTPARVVAA